jgi:RimJ/RimL family protein N-acetyltransferase
VTVGPEVRTERLLLRRWRETDLEPFAAMNADPLVMEYLGVPLTAEQSDAFVKRTEEKFSKFGFGVWAVEVIASADFIGFVGLNPVDGDFPFGPAVEVGWRLARSFWHNGYATEAAVASVVFGFESLSLDEIVSMTVPANLRSRAVMERLGMTHDPGGDFDHPKIAIGHPLCRHVLYRLDAPAHA